MNIFLWIWSHIPILCLSDDKNFATPEWKSLKGHKCHLRISLINIMLGDVILYLITYDIEQGKPAFVKILRLQELEGVKLTDEDIAERQEGFRQHLKDLRKRDLAVEKEKLCYLIQNEEQRISSSLDKINIYATIILTVLPLMLAVIDLKDTITLPPLLISSIILMIYSLINICAYVFNTIKVQGIEKSTFSDLRSSQDRSKEILIQYQYDWQQLKYKAQLFVSYVLNLQEWVILILILTVGISIGVNFKNIRNNRIPISRVMNNEIITLNIDNVNEPYNQDTIKWKELLLDIEKKRCKYIVFIGNYDKAPTFIDELNRYSGLKIEFLHDPLINKGQIKIIRKD